MILDVWHFPSTGHELFTWQLQLVCFVFFDHYSIKYPEHGDREFSRLYNLRPWYWNSISAFTYRTATFGKVNQIYSLVTANNEEQKNFETGKLYYKISKYERPCTNLINKQTNKNDSAVFLVSVAPKV